MSVLQSIENALTDALTGVDFPVGLGEYPANAQDPCGKVVFTAKDKPAGFLNGGDIGVETFKVVVRGNDYKTLETKVDAVKSALKAAGFIQIGGYEDVEPKESETFMQLAVNFKLIKQN